MIKRVLRFCIRPVNVNLVVMLITALLSVFFLFIGVVPFVFLVIVARIVYSAENSERLTAYRAIMGICYVGGLITLLLFGGLMLWAAYSSYFIFIVTVYIALFALLIMCIINTYTKRILK